ncbi:rhomboid domain-containing protein 2 isoform X2 [Alosa sapidissima]|uniref:rhomboid domain-containing protein 2 isoform X2 n=1 Tax=Alosa sapidissima TaxID=34773 RepID=UPI001C089B9D|nr:rhomboid domain-containing protein 2 isoform X2 [Alosa sapidissima]
MLSTFETLVRQLRNFSSVFEITSGICLAILTSASVCIFTSILDVPVLSLGVDSSVFTSGHVPKLLSYPFIHCDVLHLMTSAVVLVAFSSAVEKGVGTVRFLALFLLLSTATGLLFALLALVVFPEPSEARVAMGLVPVALSLLGMVTISSRMKRALLLGVGVPTATLPWIVLLAVTLVIPGMVLLCNATAITVGIIYGKGWLSPLEMSESRASLLEKRMPLRLLKRIMGVRFIPASAEERKEILHARCNPPPGSYPVQVYAPAPTAPSTNQTHGMYEGWSHSAYSQQSPSPFPGTHAAPYGLSQTHGHSSAGDGHGHSHHGHGHSHDGYGHSYEGHGHSHEGHGHSHEGHGYVHGQYGHYAGQPVFSQFGHGLGAAAYGQHAASASYAAGGAAYPAERAWMPPSAPVPPHLSSGVGTAAAPTLAHNPEPQKEN